MNTYLIILLIALVISALGFIKYVYFISLGYGFSIAGIGMALLVTGRGQMDVIVAAPCILLTVYGIRLGGYLLVREIRSASYRTTMKREIKDGSDMKLGVKMAIWVSCALLYTFQVAPVYFRLKNGGKSDGVLIAGTVIMLCGILLESVSDLQKTKAKKKNPNRFVDTGLFRIVRCPNYLGEILFWTGVLLSGVTALRGAVQWIVALLGYVCIVYIMFGGARRLEIRQNKNYGSDPEYQKYTKTTPILIPLVPLYSVEKYKFLVG